jgi:hypothetical protein
MRYHRRHLVVRGWAASAQAEDSVPSAAPGTRTVADTPFQLVLPQGHLFGDWTGRDPGSKSTALPRR